MMWDAASVPLSAHGVGAVNNVLARENVCANERKRAWGVSQSYCAGYMCLLATSTRLYAASGPFWDPIFAVPIWSACLDLCVLLRVVSLELNHRQDVLRFCVGRYRSD
eukprot:4212159-Amphidinium_carterae.1